MEAKNSPEEMEKVARRPRISPKALIPVVLILLTAVGTGFIIRERPEILGLAKSQDQAQREVDSLISEVGNLIALPEERPTVATVTDISKVSEQQFFKNAQNGDKVLIYPSEKKAILYRPSEKRILEVGAVNINEQQGISEETVTPEEIEPVVSNVVLLNGTGVSGLTARVQTRLDQVETLNAEYLTAQNAQSTEYTGTVIVVLDEASAANAQVIAEELGGNIGSLPEGETEVDGADIMVIVGAQNSEI